MTDKCLIGVNISVSLTCAQCRCIQFDDKPLGQNAVEVLVQLCQSQLNVMQRKGIEQQLVDHVDPFVQFDHIETRECDDCLAWK
jgi:hypothetical protein